MIIDLNLMFATLVFLILAMTVYLAVAFVLAWVLGTIVVFGSYCYNKFMK